MKESQIIVRVVPRIIIVIHRVIEDDVEIGSDDELPRQMTASVKAVQTFSKSLCSIFIKTQLSLSMHSLFG